MPNPPKASRRVSKVRLGVDFACNSELIIRLEKDDVGANPFRIDFEVIPASDDRNPPT